MRPFYAEYQTIAGFHDGVRARVVDSAAARALVAIHESIHGRIFRETPDGQIHSAFQCATEERLLTGDAAIAVAKSSRIFFEACRLPHESFATYLSVKMLPGAEEPAAIGELTSEYLEYFRLLSDVIDAPFTSSHLQFLVGWNCVIAVFSSPLLERFHSVDTSEPVRLSEDEHPERRFEALLKVLRGSKFDDLKQLLRQAARATCVKEGLREWDIFSELAWLEATIVDGEYTHNPVPVEKALSEVLSGWLQSAMPFTILSGDRLKTAFNPYPASLEAKLNFPTYDLRGPELDGDFYGPELLVYAMSESGSRIVNTKTYRLAFHDDLAARTQIILQESSSIAVYSACPPRNMSHWSLFSWAKGQAADSDDRPEFFAEFPRADVLEFLARWLDQMEQTTDAPDLRALVVAIQDFPELVQYLSKSEFPFWRHELLAKRLCWYSWGGTFDIYRVFATRNRPLSTGRLFADGQVAGNARGPLGLWGYTGSVIKIFQPDIEPGMGLFIKAFSPHSSAGVAQLEEALISDGKLKQMSADSVEEFRPLVREAFYGVRSLWIEY